MGCNSSKAEDIQQGEQERKRKPPPGPETVNSPARAISGRPGPYLKGDLESKSYTNRRQLEHEQFSTSLRDEEQVAKMRVLEEQRILEQTTKSMFDLTQLDAPGPEPKGWDSSTASILAQTEIDSSLLDLSNVRGLRMPSSSVSLVNDVDKILSKQVDEGTKAKMGGYSSSLGSAFQAMQVADVGDLIETFPALRRESPN